MHVFVFRVVSMCRGKLNFYDTFSLFFRALYTFIFMITEGMI